MPDASNFEQKAQQHYLFKHLLLLARGSPETDAMRDQIRGSIRTVMSRTTDQPSKTLASLLKRLDSNQP